jgi:tripartite-type tricarboxylate transporter receptor subunit TctC
VKILATGARKRTAAIPDVPTVSETVPGYDLLTWYGMWYPKRTPSSIVTRMHAELAKVLALPEIARAFDTLGIEPAPSTPIELENYVKAETERWRKVIATAGIRLE